MTFHESELFMNTGFCQTLYRLILGVMLILPVAVLHAGYMAGYVYTRALVTNEAGNHTWGEYDPANGRYIRDIAEATGDYDPAQWRVMSGAEYLGYVEQYNNLRTQYADLDVPLSRTQYEAQTFFLADGVTHHAKPALAHAVAYVSLLPQSRRFIDDPEALILADYPIDPSQSNGVGTDTLSLLVKYDGADRGQVKAATGNRIGFKTAFLQDENGEPIPVPSDTYGTGFKLNRAAGETVMGPVAGVKVESGFFTQTVTGSDGFYSLKWFSIPCPMWYSSRDGSTTATLRYRRFNPRTGRNASDGVYFLMRPYIESCTPDPYPYIVPFFGPFPLGFGTISMTPYNTHFPVDVTVLSGAARLSSEISVQGNQVSIGGNPLPVGAATQFTAETPDNSATQTDGYDFDDDGTPDTVIAGRFGTDAEGQKIFIPGIDDVPPDQQLQGVWLSRGGKNPAETLPDLTRVMDAASFSGLTHQGLLSQISPDDLKNTDLYVTRVSDGKLIAERIGLTKYEADALDSGGGVDANGGQFFYSLPMRNSFADLYRFARGGYRFRSDFNQWQSDSGLNPELHARDSDHVKPGDLLRIYAINRATGYMGHTDTTVQAAGSTGTGDLSFHIDPIRMGPPNLTIRAERDYNIQAGLEKGDLREDQIIGFEGASLTSDKAVKIITEWLDHNGRAIPESLAGAGYTGRIAMLSADKTLPNDNQGVYQFAIEPGQHLQVLQLPNNIITDAQHFYIHVSGEPQSGNPIFAGSQNRREADFTSSGQNPGILASRPNNYVPFRVPVFDEAATELQRQAYRQIKRDNPSLADTLDSPKPIYRWVYRPEMQFSSYQLAMNELQIASDNNNDGTIQPTESVNILANTIPLIPSDNIVALLYDLNITNLVPLDYFNAGESQQLLFTVGEQELTATVGADQTLRFEDISHIELLDPEDFLTIRLYANNDMGNTLWEYAFNKNGLHVYYKIPHEETEIKLEKAETDTLRVRTLGGLRLKYEYILPAEAYFNGSTDKITWKMGVPGRYCADYGIKTANCTADGDGTHEYTGCHTAPTDRNEAGQVIRCSMYWEPLDPGDTTKVLWNTNLNADAARVQVDFTNHDGTDKQDEQGFLVETRVLKPLAPDPDDSQAPMNGGDVEMLEAMLWQFGLSPQIGSGNAGTLGARIASNRAGVDGGPITTTSCDGELAKLRNIFYRGRSSNCAIGNVSTETMIMRFQARNDNDNYHVSEAEIAAQDGIVGPDTLKWLKRDWELYNQAYQDYSARPIIQSGDADFNNWLALATGIWDGAISSIPASYTQVIHEQILESAGLATNALSRADILGVWIRGEGPFHWGTNNTKKLSNGTRVPYQATSYRMLEGGDEQGSLSFSQLTYPWRFGDRSACEAHTDANLNLYDPVDQIKTFAVHTAAKVGTKCPGGIHRAFLTTQLTKKMPSDLKGHIKSGAVEAIVTNSNEGNYELLAKGIGLYNGAAGKFTTTSWPALLKDQIVPPGGTVVAELNTEDRCHSCKYSIEIRHTAGLGYRAYVWKGGEAIPDDPATTDIDESQPAWCFKYGEKEWLEGKSWKKYLKYATDYQAGIPTPGTPDPRENCP